MIDIHQALLNPSSVFASPKDVAHHKNLSRTQKIEILRRWAQDAQALQVAEDENMTAASDQPLSCLDDAMKALHELGEELVPNPEGD